MGDLFSGVSPSAVDSLFVRRLLPRRKIRPSKLGNRLVQLRCCVNSRALSRSFCKRRLNFLSDAAAVLAVVAADTDVLFELIDLSAARAVDIAFIAVDALNTWSISGRDIVASVLEALFVVDDDFCRAKPDDTALVAVAKILSVSDSNDCRANTALFAAVKTSCVSGSVLALTLESTVDEDDCFALDGLV